MATSVVTHTPSHFTPPKGATVGLGGRVGTWDTKAAPLDDTKSIDERVLKVKEKTFSDFRFYRYGKVDGKKVKKYFTPSNKQLEKLLGSGNKDKIEKIFNKALDKRELKDNDILSLEFGDKPKVTVGKESQDPEEIEINDNSTKDQLKDIQKELKKITKGVSWKQDLSSKSTLKKETPEADKPAIPENPNADSKNAHAKILATTGKFVDSKVLYDSLEAINKDGTVKQKQISIYHAGATKDIPATFKPIELDKLNPNDQDSLVASLKAQSQDQLYIPVHAGGHFSHIYVDKNLKQIIYYDSNKPYDHKTTYSDKLESLLETIKKAFDPRGRLPGLFGKNPFEVTSWIASHQTKIPNGCGPLGIRFIENISTLLNDPKKLTDQDYKKNREQFVNELQTHTYDVPKDSSFRKDQAKKIYSYDLDKETAKEKAKIDKDLDKKFEDLEKEINPNIAKLNSELNQNYKAFNQLLKNTLSKQTVQEAEDTFKEFEAAQKQAVDSLGKVQTERLKAKQKLKEATASKPPGSKVTETELKLEQAFEKEETRLQDITKDLEAKTQQALAHVKKTTGYTHRIKLGVKALGDKTTEIIAQNKLATGLTTLATINTAATSGLALAPLGTAIAGPFLAKKALEKGYQIYSEKTQTAAKAKEAFEKQWFEAVERGLDSTGLGHVSQNFNIAKQALENYKKASDGGLIRNEKNRAKARLKTAINNLPDLEKANINRHLIIRAKNTDIMTDAEVAKLITAYEGKLSKLEKDYQFSNVCKNTPIHIDHKHYLRHRDTVANIKSAINLLEGNRYTATDAQNWHVHRTVTIPDAKRGLSNIDQIFKDLNRFKKPTK